MRGEADVGARNRGRCRSRLSPPLLPAIAAITPQVRKAGLAETASPGGTQASHTLLCCPSWNAAARLTFCRMYCQSATSLRVQQSTRVVV